MTPEELFEHLLRHRELVNYRRAYELLIGPVAIWHNWTMAPEVVAAARTTARRDLGALTIRLDSLIVNLDSRLPSDEHFDSNAHTKAQWIEHFRAWSLCRHELEAVVPHHHVRRQAPEQRRGPPPFEAGQLVTHTEFGEGAVQDVAEGTDGWNVSVLFTSGARREIDSAYLRMCVSPPAPVMTSSVVLSAGATEPVPVQDQRRRSTSWFGELAAWIKSLW